MLGILFAVLSVVVLAGWLVQRREVRETVEGRRPVVTDDTLREIMEHGSFEATEDEPLDEEEIREAEDEFWEGSEWDDPEAFHP